MNLKLPKKSLFILIIFIISFLGHAQVGVGTLTPANSAQLDVTATNKGLLIPRLSLIQTTNQSPVAGAITNSLLVYNTATVNDVTPGFYYWQTDKWIRLIGKSDPVIFNETLTTLTYDANTNRLTYKDENGVSNVLQLVGQVGPVGPVGPQGPPGIAGNNGAKGDKGDSGAQGIPGNDGVAGAQGGIGLIVDGTNTTVIGSGTTADPYKINTPSMPAATVSNTSAGNLLNTTVNGVTGPNVTIINSNTLTAVDGNLVSTVNGVATTASVPVLIAADNGLTAANGKVQLGGSLTQPTTITTDNTNTLALKGLQQGTPSEELLMVEPNTGVIRKISSNELTGVIKEEFTAFNGQKDFSTTQPISSLDKIQVFRNGTEINFTATPGTSQLTLQLYADTNGGCLEGDQIKIYQWR
ncbi:hypothetical protein [Flavobacterium panacagri]|uniref:hypothetical protein n=1 Tax=Flavobacterium panacagri TaxID=3034146 RepID=UPI0025A5A732|nr:hypothetical protein [Flavobacterium panacagri]